MQDEPAPGSHGKAKARDVGIDWHRWDGDMSKIQADWRSTDLFTKSPLGGLVVRTLRGRVSCPVGWYVIHGDGGDFYPVPPAIFHRRWEVIT